MRRGPLAAVICLALTVSAPAQAKDINTKIAQKHYELGEQLYQASNYAKALAEFKKAYELEPVPGLLFNIARCYEVMADLEQAIEYYRRYLDKKPAAKNKDLVKVRLKNLNDRLLRQRKSQQQEQDKAQGSSRPDSGELVPPEDPATADPAGPQPEEPPAGGWKRMAGWATLGAGAASLVTGVIFGALAKSKADDYADGVEQQQDFGPLDEIDAAGKRYETIQLVTLIVGGVAAAAGGGLLLWHYLGGSKRETAAVVAPFVSADAVGFGATGRF